MVLPTTPLGQPPVSFRGRTVPPWHQQDSVLLAQRSLLVRFAYAVRYASTPLSYLSAPQHISKAVVLRVSRHLVQPTATRSKPLMVQVGLSTYFGSSDRTRIDQSPTYCATSWIVQLGLLTHPGSSGRDKGCSTVNLLRYVVDSPTWAVYVPR